MNENNDTIAVIHRTNEKISAARSEFNLLLGRWIGEPNPDAKQIARNELCSALVRRLEIAEKESLELIGMLEIARSKTVENLK